MTGEGVVLEVKVTPRSSKNAVTGILANGTVKIKLQSPPVDGAANIALVEFLSTLFQVKKDRIRILSGQTSPLKRVLVQDRDEHDVRTLLHTLI